jgi:pimeloyl-ACP methyl ester carboxylesterase
VDDAADLIDVLIVPGSPDCGDVWEPVVAYVAATGTACQAIDLPGHGSNNSQQPTTIEGYADWVEAYLELHGMNDILLVGHSMGALIALEVAGRSNSRLARIILFGVGHPMAVAPFLLDAAMDDPDRAVHLIVKWSLEPSDDLEVNQRAEAHALLVQSQPPGVLATALHACNNYAGALDAAGLVTVPTTVVIAEADRMVPPQTAEPIISRLGLVDRIVMSGASHAVQDEFPKAVAAIISRAAALGRSS